MKLSIVALLSGLASLAAAQTSNPLFQSVDNTFLEIDYQLAPEHVTSEGAFKLYNEEDTPLNLVFTNRLQPGDGPIIIAGIFGSVYEKPTVNKKTGEIVDGEIVRNLTLSKLGPLTLEPGQTGTIEHSIMLIVPPKDFDLGFSVLVQHGDQLLNVRLNDHPITVLDVPISSFDPRLLLVQLLLGVTAAVGGYYGSRKLVLPFLESKMGSNKKTTAKEETKATKTTESGKGYDESWIPEHHLRSRTVKK